MIEEGFYYMEMILFYSILKMVVEVAEKSEKNT
jgi:hypothetical protein